MVKWYGIFVLLLGMIAYSPMPIKAQGSGQFCVRAYEDANGNMMRDPGEPLLEAGIVITLHDMRGVILATASLATSPTREQGLVCFNNLPDGQYALFVDSVQYRATTTENMIAQITTTNQLAVLEYGGQAIRPSVPPPATIPTASPSAFQPNWERLGVAGMWGLATTMLVGTLGLFLHALFIRPYNRRIRQSKSKALPTKRLDYTPREVKPVRNYYDYEDVDEYST